jgi:hypothetical protein
VNGSNGCPPRPKVLALLTIALVIGRPALRGSTAQPRELRARGAPRRTDRAREPPCPDGKPLGSGRAGAEGRRRPPAGDVQPRRLQGLQRRLRASGGRRPPCPTRWSGSGRWPESAPRPTGWAGTSSASWPNARPVRSSRWSRAPVQHSPSIGRASIATAARRLGKASPATYGMERGCARGRPPGPESE